MGGKGKDAKNCFPCSVWLSREKQRDKKLNCGSCMMLESHACHTYLAHVNILNCS